MVKDVMQQTLIIMDGMETVKDAIKALQKEDARCVVIKKRHEHDEYGIVLVGDIAKQVIALDRSPERVNLYEIMSKPVISVHPDMDIRYTSRLFERFGLSQAPVIDGDEVVGLVTYAGIVLHGLVEEK
jgi:predicted transcriptional regulator